MIKICGNPRTVRTTKEHIDVDVTGLLRRPPPVGPPHKKVFTCGASSAVAPRIRDYAARMRPIM